MRLILGHREQGFASGGLLVAVQEAPLDGLRPSYRLSGFRQHTPLRFCPSFRHELLDLPVRHRWQTRQHILQVSVRIEPSPPATLSDRVHDGTAFPGFGFAKEQPVFLPYRRGPDRPFGGLVVDLHPPVSGIHQHGFPLSQGIANCFSKTALRQDLAFGF